MYLISHRGNINGIQKSKENDPNYINKAIESGFDVEVDVRYTEGKFFLGHDYDQYKIDKDFLLNEKIWCHAKTNIALSALHEELIRLYLFLRGTRSFHSIKSLYQFYTDHNHDQEKTSLQCTSHLPQHQNHFL